MRLYEAGFVPWLVKVEKTAQTLLGLPNLGGDQEEDGYSLGRAVEAFEEGLTPAQYVDEIIANRGPMYESEWPDDRRNEMKRMTENELLKFVKQHRLLCVSDSDSGVSLNALMSGGYEIHIRKTGNVLFEQEPIRALELYYLLVDVVGEKGVSHV